MGPCDRGEYECPQSGGGRPELASATVMRTKNMGSQAEQPGTVYRYPHLTRQILIRDIAFRGGPRPGEPMPGFDLPSTDDTRIRKRDFVGRRPLLLTCTSITCPMAATMGSSLRRLHAEFGDRVDFVTLYVREAHPGERYPQPETHAQKLAHARAYHGLERFSWPIAVDNVDGDLHRALDPRPNAAYLMDRTGNVAFRALASNDERVLREGLQALVTGRPLPVGEREPLVIPMLKASGVMREVLDRAGPQATQDIRRELPGVYPLLCLAALFRPLPPLARGVAALVTVAVVVTVPATWLATRVASRT